VGVLSGFYPGRRFNSHVNHAAYCWHHGLYYVDASYPGRDRRRYFRKLEMIEHYLPLFDWLFWIDDDAYFTAFDQPLDGFLALVEGHHMLVCSSPSTKTLFTKISSGQFFLRNSPESLQFIREAMRVDLDRVRREFWLDRHGFFSGGDQDAMVYLSEAHPDFRDGFMKIIPHDHFNNRDFEYATRLDEHFLVHFTGKDKVKSKRAFCKRLRANKYLLPENVLAQLDWREGDDGA
jgi:hypothetical protein